MQFFLPLVKADQEKRLVYARAAVEEPDKAREIMDYATAVPQFRAWSTTFEKATLGKSLGNIRAMHNPKHLAGKVQEIVYNDGEKAVDVCIKVLDPVDWHKVEEGGYTGLSIGGGYLKKWTDPATGCTRYTPRIAEISFVDSPCIPSARILELQKADGSVEEVLLKGVPRTFAELVPPPTFGELLQKAFIPPMAGAVRTTVRGMLNDATHTRGKQLTFTAGDKSAEDARSAWQYATSRGKSFSGENVSTGPTYTTPRGKTFKPGKPADEHMGGQYTSRGKTFKQADPFADLEKNILPALGAVGGMYAGTKLGLAASRRIGGRVARRMVEHNESTGTGPGVGKVPAGSVLPEGARVHRRLGQRLTEQQKNRLMIGAAGGTVAGYAGGYYGGMAAGHHAERHIKRKIAAFGQPKGFPTAAAKKQELIDNLQKDFLTEPDNTISQWSAGRSDQTYKPNPFTLHQNKDYFPGFPGGAAKVETLADLAKRLPKPTDSPEAREKIHTVLHEFKHGGLRSYRGVNPRTGKPRKGPKVTDRRQAIAIALNQARRMGKGDEPAFVAALAGRLEKRFSNFNTMGAEVAAHHALSEMGAEVAAHHALSEKEREQRVTAAKARWAKEGHPNLDDHHQAVMAQAKKAILGRANKVAAAQALHDNTWHSVADAHDAYDKMRPHTQKSHAIMMEVPHTGGLVYNPEGIGGHHFDRNGKPKKTIYLMHPHEVDDWIAKHGIHSKTVRKDAPYGEVTDIDDLFNPPSNDEERLEKFIIPAALGLGAAYMGAKAGARTGAALGAHRMVRGLAAGTATNADIMGHGIVRSARVGATAGAVGGGAAGVALGHRRSAESKQPKAA